jgi:hypothetical protein
MIEKAREWLDEVYHYISETYHTTLLAEEPTIVFQDKKLDSTLYTPRPDVPFPFPHMLSMREHKRKFYMEEYGVELPKTIAMILPSKKAVEAALQRAMETPSSYNILFTLTKNYDLYIYRKIWHESFHDYGGSLPLNLLKRIGYTIWDITEILPVAYTFFGILTGYEKGLAERDETEEVIKEQIKVYQLYPMGMLERYQTAMRIFFKEDFRPEELMDLLHQDKTHEAKKKIESRAKKILKEFHDLEIE